MLEDSLSDELNEEEARANALVEWERIQSSVAGLIARLSDDVKIRVRRRAVATERRWLDDLRQYHGLYDATTAAILKGADERSSIFVNITRPKTTAWAARLGDMLFPNDAKNWGIHPTPVPELTEKAKAAVRDAETSEAKAMQAADDHNQMVEAGAGPDAIAGALATAEGHAAEAMTHREFEREVSKLTSEADRRAAAMEREIDDQLVESRYAAICRDVIDDAVKLGIGVLKGPLTSSKPRRRWMQDDGGAYALVADADPRPMFRRVNPWHFYPDPDATDMHDGESTFERHLLSRSGLARMAKMLDWHAPTVAALMQEGPTVTDSTDFNWLTELRTIDDATESGFINRHVVWEYHGPMLRDEVEAMLQSLGRFEEASDFIEHSDDLNELMVICYFCQGRLLKIEEYFPLDSGESLYSAFPFEKSEANILGAVGVPHLMRHEQSMLNSAVRMMMDNAALSVGPQIVIDRTQIEPENGDWKLTPRKVWKAKGQDIAPRTQGPFATYNIPMNQAQLAGIIDLALRFIDDVVSMPTIAQGEQGAHVTQTANGMSMLFNSANVVFRRVVKNWDDDLTTPTIRRAFDWNMQFSTKDDIKGDMQVAAQGTSVLLVREVQSQQLMVIAEKWSTHPLIGPAIKVYEVLSMTLQALNISPNQILVDPDEFEKRLKAMAESAAGQESPDVIRAKAQLEVAKIDADSRREQSQFNLQIAEMNQKTEIMKLIQKDGVDLARIEALLKSKALDTDSKERLFAAEAAMERQAADEARARGEAPSGSGGYISAGGGVE